jgi:hypothetical protein
MGATWQAWASPGTWTAQRMPARVSVWLTSVSAYSPSDAWAVGGGVLEHWDGTMWKAEVRSGLSSPELAGVTMNARTNALAVGDYFNATRQHWEPLALHFDGQGWSRQHAAGFGNGDSVLSGVSVASDGSAWAVGHTGCH